MFVSTVALSLCCLCSAAGADEGPAVDPEGAAAVEAAPATAQDPSPAQEQDTTEPASPVNATELDAGAAPRSAGALLVFQQGDLRLVMNGLLQAEMALWTGDDNQLAEGDAAEHPGFRLRRARVGWSARAFRFMYLKATMELGGGAERKDARVVDASIAYRHFSLVGFELGIHKVPFSRYALVPAGYQALSARPLAVQAMAPFRQVGLTLSGEVARGIIQYAMGVFNGIERAGDFHQGYVGALDQGGNQTGPLAVAARLSLAPRGALGKEVADVEGGPLRIALGTSALRQGAEDRTQVAWSVDLALKVRGFHFLGEYISDYSELVDVAADPGASSQGAAVAERLDRTALVGEVGYTFLAGRLGAAARVEWLDTDEATDDEGDAVVFTGGLQHIWHRHHLKAHLEYTYREELHGAARDNQTLLLHLQARL